MSEQRPDDTRARLPIIAGRHVPALAEEPLPLRRTTLGEHESRRLPETRPNLVLPVLVAIAVFVLVVALRLALS